MTLEEAQKTVDNWIKTYGVRYFSELTNMAVLTEEVGNWHVSCHANMVTSHSNLEKKITSTMKWPMYYGC